MKRRPSERQPDSEDRVRRGEQGRPGSAAAQPAGRAAVSVIMGERPHNPTVQVESTTGPEVVEPTGGTDSSVGSDGARQAVDDLRRRLRSEQERVLQANDRTMGARAEAAEARARVRELEHLAHVQACELTRLKSLLAEQDRGREAQRPASTIDGAVGLLAPALGDSPRELGRALRRRLGDVRQGWAEGSAPERP